MSFIVPPDAVSWVDYEEDSHFPIQNIPFGAYVGEDLGGPTACTAIGEYVVDLALLEEAGLIEGYGFVSGNACQPLFDGGPTRIRALRQRLFELLHEDEPLLQEDHELQSQAFVLQSDIQMALPTRIGAFVDFYSGIHHASNVGKMFRPDQPPLLPNYRWLPIGYNGRASSVVPTGTAITRPCGQTKGPNDESPTFGPTKELDFELEMGFFVARDNELGRAVPIERAEDYIFGLVIVNDWSARDVQRWEYQPLGPFLAKSFGTSISPWIVTLDALEPFRVSGIEQDPLPLPYLRQPSAGHFEIELEVGLRSGRMAEPQIICRSNTKNLYWTVAQQLAHQASNGTNIGRGDLYASGTISGPENGTFGSMLELSWRGQQPITLEETGETRTFLEDGDTVVMSAFAQGDGFRVGFGEVSGSVSPASQMA